MRGARPSADELTCISPDQPGGAGVRVGSVVERLFRDTRALRIYEGTSEVQKLVLAKHVLKHTPAPDAGASD